MLCFSRTHATQGSKMLSKCNFMGTWEWTQSGRKTMLQLLPKTCSTVYWQYMVGASVAREKHQSLKKPSESTTHEGDSWGGNEATPTCFLPVLCSRPGPGLLICILLISMGKQGENWCHTADLPSMKFPPHVYPLYPWIITTLLLFWFLTRPNCDLFFSFKKIWARISSTVPSTTRNWLGWQGKFCPRTSALKSLACWSDTGAVYSHNRHGVASKQRADISVITLAEGATARAPEHHMKWQSVSYAVTQWNQPLPGLRELAMTFNSRGRLILEHLNRSGKLNMSPYAVAVQ